MAARERRSRAASLRAKVEQRDAELPRLVGEIVLDVGAGEDDDPDRQHVQHLIVALKRCGLGVFRPVGGEADLRHLAGVGPLGRDLLCAALLPLGKGKTGKEG